MEIPTKNILYFKGVFPADADKIDDKLIESESYSDKNKKKIIYDKIPKHFINIKQWIEITKNIKIRCFYCELLFFGVPTFIPTSIIQTNQGKIYEVFGIFCGFGCSYRFLISHAPFIIDRTKWEKLEMLKMLYKLFYNKEIDQFEPSPIKYEIDYYGGNTNVSDYKKKLKEVNTINTNNAIIA